MAGEITKLLANKTISYVGYDDEFLVIVTTDGHEAKIAWEADGPRLVSLDVKLQLNTFGAV